MALEGSHALVGAHNDTGAANDSGAAYPYFVLQCPGTVAAVELSRPGSPPNPEALLPGLSGPPRLGHVWDPWVDHTDFMHAPNGDWLVVSAGSANVPTPFGTLLCDLSQPHVLVPGQPGEPFLLPIPAECSFAGAALSAQAAAIDLADAGLTNALDVVIGTP